MNIEALRTFIVLANCGSFIKTAQTLIVAQSTVSGRIKELESELGQRLLNRGKSNTTLTPAGEALLVYANKIIELENNAIKEVNMVGKFSGAIHIGTTHNLYDCKVANLVQEYIVRHPDISVKMSILHSEGVISSIDVADYDIAFIYFSYQHPHYICEPFMSEPIILATSSVNKEHKAGITFKQLSMLPMIYSHLVYSILPSYRTYALNIDVISKAVPFLKKGGFYCLMPRQVIAAELMEGSLIEIPVVDITLPTQDSFMVYRKNFQHIRPLAEFVYMLKKGNQVLNTHSLRAE